MAQGEGEHAAGPEQPEQLAHGAFALAGRDVLPHAAEQDEVEGQAEPVGGGERGQGIGHPAQARAGVAALAFGTHGGRGLDRDHVVPQAGQPGRIPAGAGAHVQHQRRSGGQQVGEPVMQPFRVERLVGVGQRGGVRAVPGHGIGGVGHATGSVPVSEATRRAPGVVGMAE